MTTFIASSQLWNWNNNVEFFGTVKEVLVSTPPISTIPVNIYGTIKLVLMPTFINDTVNLTSQVAISEVGNFSGQYNPNGEAVTTEIGTFSKIINTNLDLFGRAVNTYIGNLIQHYNATVSLSGQHVTTRVGSITAFGNPIVLLTGQHVTTQIGEFAIEPGTIAVTQDFIEVLSEDNAINYQVTQDFIEILSENYTANYQVTQDFMEVLCLLTQVNINLTGYQVITQNGNISIQIKDLIFPGLQANTQEGQFGIVVNNIIPPVPPFPPVPVPPPQGITILGRAYHHTTTLKIQGQLNVSFGLKTK